VRPGIHFLVTQTGLNFNKLVWGDQISAGGTSSSIEQPPLETKADVDFSSSVLVYSEKHWLGLAVDHMLKPYNSLYDSEDVFVPLKVSVFGGTQIIRRGRLLNPIDETLSAAFLFRTQDKIQQLDLGLYWYKEPLMLGVWYRGIPVLNNEPVGDAVCVLAGYKIDQFSLGYSYDFTVSHLISSTGGAHEISMIYEFKSTRSRQKRHMIPCPEF
jgi:type IX secretion system PorP/SprF family membrane protein